MEETQDIGTILFPKSGYCSSMKCPTYAILHHIKCMDFPINFSQHAKMQLKPSIDTHACSKIWLFLFHKFPLSAILHHMRNAWVSPGISHSMRKRYTNTHTHLMHLMRAIARTHAKACKKQYAPLLFMTLVWNIGMRKMKEQRHQIEQLIIFLLPLLIFC